MSGEVCAWGKSGRWGGAGCTNCGLCEAGWAKRGGIERVHARTAVSNDRGVHVWSSGGLHGYVSGGWEGGLGKGKCSAAQSHHPPPCLKVLLTYRPRLFHVHIHLRPHRTPHPHAARCLKPTECARAAMTSGAT